MLDLIGLGVLAGVLPVYLGIAGAQLLGRAFPRAWEGGLIGVATGILLYLFFDLMHEAVELSSARDPWSWFVCLAGLGASLVGLVVLESGSLFGGGPARTQIPLPYMIAVGMGFHNLGEGLAIGASYANGEWTLSLLLVAGFALHNGSEGFGIVGASGKTPVGWMDGVRLGFIAGAPTCLGALLSGQGVSPYYSILFYTVAAGSLLYVIFSLTAISYTATRRVQTAVGVFLGISLMYITAMILTLAGGVPS